MDFREIDDLLRKYWDCETSLEEEEQLRSYFQQGNIAERHQEAASFFRYLAVNKKKSIGDERFDEKVIRSVGKNKDPRIVQLVYNSMRIAAGIAVLVVAVYFVRKEIRSSDPVAVEDTFNDPQLAFEETKKALRIISKGFTQAENQARKINLLNEATEELQKSGNSDSNNNLKQ